MVIDLSLCHERTTSISKYYHAVSSSRGVSAPEKLDLGHLDKAYMLDGVIAGFESFEDAVAAMPAEKISDESIGGSMLYSSGTTGRPKGVLKPLP